MAEGESVLVSPIDSSDEALQLDTRTDEVSVINASSDSGDYETLIRTGCESTEHLNPDISEVTLEAGKVLEQFLKLSLGQGCVSSLEGHAWTDVEPQYAVLDNIHKDSQPTPYQPMGSDQSLFENLGYSTGDVGKTVYQELTFPGQHRGCTLSGTDSPAAAVRQRSAPGKFCIMADDERTYMPLLIHKSEAGHKFPKENLRKSSSSSMGDYEYSDTVVTNRKRKSLLRLAKERLQRSFRHEKKKTTASAGSLSASVERRVADKDVRRTENSPEKLRLSRVKGSQKISYSSSSPYEVGENALASSSSLHLQVVAGQVTDTDSGVRHYMSETGYLTGETDDASKKNALTPPASKKLGTKSKARKNRDIFGGIFKQLRKSSQKPQVKAKEGCASSKSTASPTVVRASCSADTEGQLPARKLPISSKGHTSTSHSQKTSAFDAGQQRADSVAQLDPYTEVPRFVGPQSPHVLHCGTSGRDTAQNERRSRMQLEGLVPCLPTSAHGGKDVKSSGGPLVVAGGLGSWKAEERNLDETDGGRRDLKSFLLHHSSKPFSQKTEKEKDELYEHIAGQLATIAYNYTSDSPPNSTVKQQEALKAAEDVKATEVSVEQIKTSGLECSARSSFQPPAERSPYSLIDSTPVVAELVQSTSYRCFEQIITSSIGASETGWHQIAMMFRLTQSAIMMAGMGTSVALHIKELTLKYFEDRFANWIVTQGGWESMVDETNTELDSELD